MNYQEVIKSITTTIFSQVQSLIKEAPLGELKQGQIGIVNKSDVYSL